VPNSNRKGDRRERQLARAFDDRGWAVIRAPASGSATKRELPDLLVGKDGALLALEVKASGGRPIYIDRPEVEALEWFGRHFGAQALLAVLFDEEHGDPTYGTDIPGAYFFGPEQCHRTDTGTYRVKKRRAINHGRTIDELD